MKKIGLALLFFLALPTAVMAHCPLCTVGAAAAAAGASALGVSNTIIGVFVGAFAVSTAWWVSNKIKKQYVPHQRAAIIISSFLLTIIPLMFAVQSYYGIYISLGGDYGTVFNRTYLLNRLLAGSIIGGLILLVTPHISRKITELRHGSRIPYQGLAVTFACLIIASGLIQAFMR